MFKSLMTCAALLATLQSVDAHSKMTVPKPNSEISNSPSGLIDGPTTLSVPAGMSFGYGPAQNTEAFHKAFAAQTKYKTIRDIVYDKFKPEGASTKECGFSAATGTPQPLPDFVEYGNGGFDSSHEGPCEVWCDDVKVFYNENCAVNFPQKPAKLPYDKAKCAGAKRLQSFWLALHVPAWQAYISCATLTGAGGAAGGGGTAPSPAVTDAPAPDSPPVSTPATVTTKPTPATNAPAPAATSASKPTANKCTPKRFRRD